jgi:hypothetical protein
MLQNPKTPCSRQSSFMQQSSPCGMHVRQYRPTLQRQPACQTQQMLTMLMLDGG